MDRSGMAVSATRSYHATLLFIFCYRADIRCESRAEQATGIDYPLFEGVSCVPPSLARYNASCTLGGYPAYIVNITNGMNQT